MEEANVVIIGAGVVGLAVGSELASVYPDVFIVERNSSFGQETSSRNSEVIHAGIYYPKDSLKAKTCIEGRRLLYEFCAKYNIAHRKIGKLIVAIDDSEIADLEKLFKQGMANGVDDLKLISKAEVKKLEPNVEAAAAIHSPSTGILDTHGFMAKLFEQFKGSGGHIAYEAEAIGIEKVKDAFRVVVKYKTGERFEFKARILINCAGLNSDKIAALAGLNGAEYKLKYCKGDYFRVSAGKAKLISRLVYPVPKKDRAGLGIHATLDLSGGLRLGPDDEYVKKIDYDVDVSKAKVFYEGTRRFLPFIEPGDITPDMAGMRPKLQGPGECFRDFIIKDEAGNGFSGLINLVGIESPGLTAALSIAKMVKGLAAVGRMAERPNAAVSKTVIPQGIAGSNPAPSAK